MTCIVGLAENGTVWMGGDSAGVSGYSSTSRADQKVFINGDFILGFTSSFRMGQILRYRFEPPRYREDFGPLPKFMCTMFIDGVRMALKNGGWAWKENDRESGGAFLVGTQGKLFRIDSDYQVGEYHDNYGALGCGEDLALGSLHSSRHFNSYPHKRLCMALEAAAHHSAGVRDPFTILSL